MAQPATIESDINEALGQVLINMGFDPALESVQAASPLGLISPSMTWLSPEDERTVRSTLPTDGQFSSDGELSSIAREEAAIFRANNGILIKSEDEMGSERPGTSHTTLIVNPATLKRENQALLDHACGTMDRANQATGSAPSTQDWSGELAFSLRIPPAAKSKDGQYSHQLNKLFINQNRVVHAHFTVRPSEDVLLPPGLMIRALAIYTRPDDYEDPVHVCPSHSKDSLGQLKSPYADHLIRCTLEKSCYIVDAGSRRHSVVTEVPQPQPGCNEVVIGYRFMDLGSCAGGLNRRETAIIFTLELGNAVLGRRVLSLRICTCPKRDMESEEKQGKKVTFEHLADPNQGEEDIPPPGKVRVDKKEPMWILTYGKDNFETVKTVAEALVKKDGGDVVKWGETVKKFNELSKPAKRLKIDKME